MPQSLEKVWLYSDAQASMDAAAGIAVEVSRRHSASLTILGGVEASVGPLLKTALGQELVRLVREDKLKRLRQLEVQVAAEDLPNEGAAGPQETYLNVHGTSAPARDVQALLCLPRCRPRQPFLKRGRGARESGVMCDSLAT